MVQEFPSPNELNARATSSGFSRTIAVANISSSSISAPSSTMDADPISSIWSMPATVSNHLVELQKEIKEEEEEIFADLNSLIDRSYLFPNVCAEDSYQDSSADDDPINLDDYENRVTFNNFRPQVNPISKNNEPNHNHNHTNETHDNARVINSGVTSNCVSTLNFQNCVNDLSDSTTSNPRFTVSKFERPDSTSSFNQSSCKPPSSLGSPIVTTTTKSASNFPSQVHRFESDAKKDFNDDLSERVIVSRSRLGIDYYSDYEDSDRLDGYKTVEHRVTYKRSNNNNNNIYESNIEDKPNQNLSELLPQPQDESCHQNNQDYQAIIQRITTNQPKPCVFFLEGNCRRSDCKYSHDLSNIVCKYWIEGFCFKGEMCPFLHSYDANADATGSTSDDESVSKKNLNPTFAIESETDFPSLPFENPGSVPCEDAKSALKSGMAASSMKNRILSSNPAVVFKTAKKKRKKG